MKQQLRQLWLSIVLVLAALAAATAATVAWFTISDRAKVQTMGLEVVSGKLLRFDLAPHKNIEEYQKVLTFEEISADIAEKKGFSMENVGLLPVTTADCETFTFQNGTVCGDTTGYYLTFTLHFMSEADVNVHLTGAPSDEGSDGTSVTSPNGDLPAVLRISFSADGQNWVYCPRMGDSRTTDGALISFGLPDGEVSTVSDRNRLFSLEAYTDKAVIVHVWMEGTDPLCVNDLQTQEYAIALRFIGEETVEQT